MGTAGADLEFINIVTRWKGNTQTHDSWVLKNSHLYSRFERNEMNGILLREWERKREKTLFQYHRDMAKAYIFSIK